MRTIAAGAQAIALQKFSKGAAMCTECYSDEDRITPLLNPEDCLKNHTQYICGTCGRCICIDRTKNGLQRWNFPFKSLTIAKLYVRTADYTMKKCCSVYAIKNKTGRIFYKIFADTAELKTYLQNNADKTCSANRPLFLQSTYREFPNTQVRRLSEDEALRYMDERKTRRSRR